MESRVRCTVSSSQCLSATYADPWRRTQIHCQNEGVLLSQLDSFQGNSKRAPEFSSYPKSSPSVLNVSKKRHRRKRKPSTDSEVKSGPIGGPLDRSVFPTTTGSRQLGAMA